MQMSNGPDAYFRIIGGTIRFIEMESGGGIVDGDLIPLSEQVAKLAGIPLHQKNGTMRSRHKETSEVAPDVGSTDLEASERDCSDEDASFEDDASYEDTIYDTNWKRWQKDHEHSR